MSLKPLGLHFADELIAAGLNNHVVFFTDGTIVGRDLLTAQQNAQLDNLIVAHNSAGSRPPVPQETALFRARAIMKITPHRDGMLFDHVMEEIERIEDPMAKALAQEAIEYANVMTRHGTLIGYIAPRLGLRDEFIDELFIRAEALPA